MLAVAVDHVAAAFKHRWIDGHDVIRRMDLRRSIGGRRSGAGGAQGSPPREGFHECPASMTGPVTKNGRVAS